ncbi:acyltransferase [Colletotrichum chrysophilum]|uniref:Acyltransferase n=1 Tax=Colletotrichum chrysophilum TaxID=1836956 RepID=A0AAD9AV53_9PEZI|nr:acyltransferase [Colletotrichum chrysophilum]
MEKLEDAGAIHVPFKEPLDRIRGWFSGAWSLKSHYILLEGDDMYSPTELPLDETERSPPLSRASIRWRPVSPQRLFWLMVPSYVARAFGRGTADSNIPAPNSTSYLNGLRGIASLIVVLQHTIDGDYSIVHHAWGEDDENRYFIQLPFVRLIHSGVFMVSVFFVISGFALTYGPLKRSHAGQGATAITSFPSSIFRRPFRLFLPTIPIIAISTALIPFNGFYALNSFEPMEPVALGLWGHLHYMWWTLITIITSGSANTVMPQGWTLAAEYQGSLLVFLSCLAFLKIAPPVRMSFTVLLLNYFFYLRNSYPCLFLAGMLIADFRHLRSKMPGLPIMARKITTVTSWLLLVPIIFLGCWPMHGNAFAAPGYSWFIEFDTYGFGPQTFFQATCAVALVVVLENLPPLQRLLNTKLVLYLGEISYSLYLVHWGCGKNFLTYGLKLEMIEAGYSLIASWGSLFVITMVLCFWLGDVHWRLVDQKSVRFSHWLSRILGI